MFTSSKVYLPDGPSPATLEVKDGKVSAVHREVLPRSAFAGLDEADYIDAGDQWLLPGVGEVCVDLHTRWPTLTRAGSLESEAPSSRTVGRLSRPSQRARTNRVGGLRYWDQGKYHWAWMRLLRLMTIRRTGRRVRRGNDRD